MLKACLMRMTIKLKLAATFGAVIALSATSGLVAYSSLTRLNNTLEQVVNGAAQRLQQAGEIRTHLLLDNRAEKNMILATTDEEIDKFAKEIMQERALARSARDAAYGMETAEAKSLLDKLAAAITRQSELQDKTMGLARLNSNTRARDLAKTDGHATINKALSALDRLFEQLDKSGRQNRFAEMLVVERMRTGIEKLWDTTKDFILVDDMQIMAGMEKPLLASIAELRRQKDAIQTLATANSLGATAEPFAEQFDGWLKVQDRVMAINREGGNILAG
jgi:methyl-accepting chemotaxis protein